MSGSTFAPVKKPAIAAATRPVVQRKEAPGAHSIAGVPLIVPDVLQSSGQPLDTATRAYMEPRFGMDFSSVRVHTDAKAAESARAVDANGLTHVVHQSGADGMRASQSTEKPGLTRAATHAHSTATLMRASPTSRAVEAVRGPGTPLPAEIQRVASLRYGQSFAHVRIHTDAPASTAAASLSAAAFTLGSNIAFRADRYAPATPQGQLLLQHELRHVAQQRSAAPAASPELDAPHSRYEREARQIIDPHVEALAVQRIQCASDDEFSLGDVAGQLTFGLAWGGVKEAAQSFSLGDVFEAMGRGAFGRAWPFLKAMFEGFLDGFQADVKSGRPDAATRRLRELVLEPWRAPKFLLGFLWGMILGLVSPITDLVKGVIGAVKIVNSALEWLQKWSPAGIAASPERQQKIVRLMQKFDQLGTEYDKALASFKLNPEETIAKFKGFLDDLMQSALEKAHDFGAKAAHSIFDFLELPDYELGKGIGEAIGSLIAQVFLFIFTGPIAKLITEAASTIGKIASIVAGKAAEVFELVKGAVSKVVSLLRDAVKGALKLFEGLLTKTIEAYDALAEIFSEAASIERAMEKAMAGGGRGVFRGASKAMKSKMVSSIRTSPAKVSDLYSVALPLPPADVPKVSVTPPTATPNVTPPKAPKVTEPPKAPSRPMRDPPGGDPRAGMTNTAKTSTPHSQSTPTVEVLPRGTVPMADFEPAPAGHYIVRKPPSAETQPQILARAGRTTDGRLRDANTGRALDDGEAVWGHAPYNQFAEMRDMAERLGWTQAQFDAFFENPAFWQIEYGPSNSGRVFDRIPRQRPVH